jgi:salicylate hydroxylase
VQKQLPILITGGGLGGLCAAFALSCRGYSVRVLERADEIKEIGAGIQLGPNVFRVLDRLGIADRVLERAVFPTRLVLMDSVSGQPVTSIDVQDDFRRRFEYPYALIHRADLLQVLFSQCSSQTSITILTSQRVVRFDDYGDRVVERLDDGSCNEGAALIGADGVASTIRAQLLGDGAPRESGYIAYRTVLRAEEMPPELRDDTMTLWAGPRHHLVHYPLRGHRLYNVVAAFRSERSAEGWETRGDAAELYSHFKEDAPPIKTMLCKIDTWRMWVLCDRDPVKDWSAGRVALLGDAAHPMLQYLGQGAGMAIEDAFVIAEEIAAAHDDYAAAFATYQARRYLRAGRAQLMSRLYGEFFHMAGPSREIRNQFLADRTPAQVRDGLAWLYDGPDLGGPTVGVGKVASVAP